jgi:nucleotide-binding universal stress UspA family protein
MYERILVPLDGSKLAEQALPVAQRIAHASGGQITLLQVVARPTPISSMYVSDSTYASWIERDVAVAREYLERVIQDPLLREHTITTRVEVGTPAAVILDVAEAEGSDLLVLSSHGRTGAALWLIGSVAEHVARQAAVPALVLRPARGAETEPLHATAERPLRALVGLDGSRFAEEALDAAATLMLALAGPHQAAVHITVALEPEPVGDLGPQENRALQGTRMYLMQVAERLQALHPQLLVGWSVVREADAAKALLELAQPAAPTATTAPGETPGGFDVIAMATHGRSGIARWTLGSVTERVLHKTTLPILVVPPRAISAKRAAHASQHPGTNQEPGEEVTTTTSDTENLWTSLF